MYLVLGYFAYRLFIPKSLQAGSQDEIEETEEEYTDYEEIE